MRERSRTGHLNVVIVENDVEDVACINLMRVFND
jgi:hypothetical protein